MKLGCDRYWLQPSKKLLALHQSVQGEFRFRDFFYNPFFLETFYGPYIWVSRPGKLF